MPNNISNQPVYLGPSGDPEQMNEPTLLYPGQLGTHFTINDPLRSAPGIGTSPKGRSKSYQLVRTDSTAAVAPFKRAVAWWSDKSQYLVTTSASKLGRGAVAGVFGPDQAPSPGNYGCIQTAGPAFVKFVDAPTAAPTTARLIVIPSATDGKADCLAAASSATYPSLGASAGTTDANSEALVDLDVPTTP